MPSSSQPARKVRQLFDLRGRVALISGGCIGLGRQMEGLAEIFGTDYDLKGAVVVLASDASAYVTGHVLVVDGGQSGW